MYPDNLQPQVSASWSQPHQETPDIVDQTEAPLNLSSRANPAIIIEYRKPAIATATAPGLASGLASEAIERPRWVLPSPQPLPPLPLNRLEPQPSFKSLGPSFTNSIPDSSRDIFRQSQLNKVLDAFALASGKLAPSPDQVRDLLLIHQMRRPPDKASIISQLGRMATMITDLSSSLPGFKYIRQEDRTVLLKANVSLYLQYVLARYFCSTTGLEQVDWILEGQFSAASPEEAASLRRISLQWFNSATGMFPNAGMVELYGRFGSNVDTFWSLPPTCNGLVANLLLLRSKGSVVEYLLEPDKVAQQYEEATKLLKIGLTHLSQAGKQWQPNFESIVDSLEAMRSIFDNCPLDSRSKDTIISNTFPATLSLKYTDTEEKWLQQKFQLFKDRYRSVEPTPDLVQMSIQLLFGQSDVNRNFVPMWICLFSERIRRVLKDHPEFQTLPSFDQVALFNKNIGVAMALSMARMSLSRTGRDQMRFALGILDSREKDWERDFPHLDAVEGKQFDHPSINREVLNKSALDFIRDTIRDIKDLVSNNQVFQLFTLVALLDVDELPMSESLSGIVKMRQIYLRLFQRKLMAAGCSYMDLAQFQKTLQKVKIYARFMESFTA